MSQLCSIKNKVMSKYIQLNDYMDKMSAQQQPSGISKKTLQKITVVGAMIGVSIIAGVTLVLANNMPPIFFESILTSLAIIALIILVMAMGTQTSKNINKKQ